MKFGQALYTWRGNQQSRYESGLGISASSTQDSIVLDNCRILGSDFQPEKTTDTVVFNVYSDRFDAHIGVGISPAKEGGDGRANMLCHFFFPIEKDGCSSEMYLLDYPFIQEVHENTVLQDMELQPENYVYEQVLETYHLDQMKLAELLYKSYQCLFLEKNLLTIVLDKEIHSKEAYQKISREIIWLLHMLIPYAETDRCVHHKYLSYGICSTMNLSAIKFHFTDEAENAEFVLKMGCPATEAIPEFFMTLASFALEGKVCAQVFLQDLMNQPLPGKLDMAKMELLYLSWKLEHGLYVSERDAEKRIPNVIRQVARSNWHDQFMRTYLRQIKSEELDNQQLVIYWKRLVIFWMEKYPKMDADQQQEVIGIIEKILIRMQEVNQTNFGHFMMQLLPDIKAQILMDFFEKRICFTDNVLTIYQLELMELLEMEGSVLERMEVTDLWLNALESRLKETVCETSISEQRIFQKICEKYEQIYRLFHRNAPGILDRYEQMVWNYMGKTANSLEKQSMFQMSMMLHQRYSKACNIWGEIQASETFFSQLKQLMQKNPGLSFLKKERKEVNKKSKYVYNCYALWEKVQKDEDASKEILFLIQDEQKDEMKNWIAPDFLQNLMEWILHHLSRNGLCNYYYLMYLEPLLFDSMFENAEKQCLEFRRIQTEFPAFAESVLNAAIPDSFALWENMELFFSIMKPEQVNYDNLFLVFMQVEAITIKFGRIPEIICLEERGMLLMGKLDQEYEELRLQIKNLQEEVHTRLKEIDDLQQKMGKNESLYMSADAVNYYTPEKLEERGISKMEIMKKTEELKHQTQILDEAEVKLEREAQEKRNPLSLFLKKKK